MSRLGPRGDERSRDGCETRKPARRNTVQTAKRSTALSRPGDNLLSFLALVPARRARVIEDDTLGERESAAFTNTLWTCSLH